MSFMSDYSWMRRTTPTSSAQVREVINVLAECERIWNPYWRNRKFSPTWKESKRRVRLVRMFWAYKNKGV